jgi:GUN4-like
MVILILIAIAVFITFAYIYQSEVSTNTLRDLLAAGKWEKANEETNRLISLTTFRAMGKDATGANGQMRPLQIDQFNYTPYSIVHAIDQLWVKYSNGHFGFSVQLDILEECKKNDWKKQQIMSNKNGGQEYAFLYHCADSYAGKGLVFDSSELGERAEVVMFWEKVGWTVGDYVSDPSFYMYSLSDFSGFNSGLNYSIRAPKGHLPFFYNKDTCNCSTPLTRERDRH